MRRLALRRRVFGRRPDAAAADPRVRGDPHPARVHHHPAPQRHKRTAHQAALHLTGGGRHHALVIPYRRGNRPTTTNQPLHTLATRDSGALVQPEIELEDCRLRMLKPREQLLGQRFPHDYQVTGNIAEQTMQAGNANPVNAAHWIGQRIAAVL